MANLPRPNLEMYPQVLILGDDTVKGGMAQVRGELLLGQPYKITHCTQYTLLQDEISKLDQSVKVLVISCFTNIVAKIGGTADAKTGLERAMGLIGSAFYELHNQRRGSIRIIVAPCTPRRSKDFSVHSNFAMRCLSDSTKGLKSVTIMSWSMSSYDLKPDGASLTDVACKKYLEEMLISTRHALERRRERTASASSVSSISSVPPLESSTPNRGRLTSIDEDVRRLLEDEETMEADDVFASAESNATMVEMSGISGISGPSGQGTDDRPLMHKLSKLEARLSKLEKTEKALANRVEANEESFLEFVGGYKDARDSDIYAIADQNERLDYLSNLARNNCVLLTGIKTKEFPKDLPSQITKATEIVKGIIQKVLNREEEFTLTVRKQSVLKTARDSAMLIVPPIEVRLSIAAAQELRSKGAALARAKTEGFAYVYFGTCITLGTRVRNEILKALGRVLSSKGGANDAYCITNSTRPLLCIGSRGSKSGRKTMLFAEAIRKYRKEMLEASLVEAYKLALPIFQGRLEQTFIVLKDSESEKVSSGANNVPVGTKRVAPYDIEKDPKRPAN